MLHHDLDADPSVVVVAGEASGDRLAASVLRHVPIPSFGIGGDALASSGTHLTSHLRSLSVMGFSGVIARSLAVVDAVTRLRREVLAHRPRAALLVDFTELNTRLGVWLRARNIPVLWLVAPQVWAWRPARLHTLGRSMDRLAVLFDFEERLWRSAGVDAHWVGHPAAEPSLPPPSPSPSPSSPSSSPPLSSASPSPSPSPLPSMADACWLPLLPGSRPSEARSLLGPMMEAARALRSLHSYRPVVLVAASLDAAHASWVRQQCRDAGVETMDVSTQTGLAPMLDLLRSHGAKAAISASGTATLECALAAIPPVILYRTDALSAGIAKKLLCVDEVGLPNIVLGRRLFPELLQGAVQPSEIIAKVLDLSKSNLSWRQVAHDLRARLAPVDPKNTCFGQRVASLLTPWL